jgi:hypothetical protein
MPRVRLAGLRASVTLVVFGAECDLLKFLSRASWSGVEKKHARDPKGTRSTLTLNYTPEGVVKKEPKRVGQLDGFHI